MTSGIDVDLFRYVDDYAKEIASGSPAGDDEFDLDWEIFTFCQLFFDQFFGHHGTNIRGFAQRSREAATTLIEGFRSRGEGSRETRAIIVLYEEFCDTNENASGRYGTATPIDVRTFHEDHLSRLLRAALEWAKSEGNSELSQRISDSISRYDQAIESVQW